MGIKIVKSALIWMCLLPCWSFHLWKNENQQAYDLFQAKRFKEAQELFNSPEWKGVAAYRNKDYTKAIQYLSQAQDAETYYNLGNSHALLGQLEMAIKAYKNALLIDPQHVDAAFNMQLLEKEIQKQEEERKRQEEERKRQEEERKRQEEVQQNKENDESAEKSPDEQQNQEWLNFIDEDPSALLKQKFLRDYQKAQQEGHL